MNLCLLSFMLSYELLEDISSTLPSALGHKGDEHLCQISYSFRPLFVVNPVGVL